jgi:CDGSH-type Zn-finger protein
MSDIVNPKKGPIVQEALPGTYFWCACGGSQKQPFCDGSHRGSGMAPLKVDVTAAGTVAWCTCKKTKTKPYCDGSHKAA